RTVPDRCRYELIESVPDQRRLTLTGSQSVWKWLQHHPPADCTGAACTNSWLQDNPCAELQHTSARASRAAARVKVHGRAWCADEQCHSFLHESVASAMQGGSSPSHCARVAGAFLRLDSDNARTADREDD